MQTIGNLRANMIKTALKLGVLRPRVPQIGYRQQPWTLLVDKKTEFSKNNNIW